MYCLQDLHQCVPSGALILLGATLAPELHPRCEKAILFISKNTSLGLLEPCHGTLCSTDRSLRVSISLPHWWHLSIPSLLARWNIMLFLSWCTAHPYVIPRTLLFFLLLFVINLEAPPRVSLGSTVSKTVALYIMLWGQADCLLPTGAELLYWRFFIWTPARASVRQVLDGVAVCAVLYEYAIYLLYKLMGALLGLDKAFGYPERLAMKSLCLYLVGHDRAVGSCALLGRATTFIVFALAGLADHAALDGSVVAVVPVSTRFHFHRYSIIQNWCPCREFNPVYLLGSISFSRHYPSRKTLRGSWSFYSFPRTFRSGCDSWGI